MKNLSDQVRPKGRKLWEVIGADRTTGPEKQILFEADDETLASYRAGLLLEHLRALSSDDSAVAALPPASPPPVHYKTPSNSTLASLTDSPASVAPGSAIIDAVPFDEPPSSVSQFRLVLQGGNIGTAADARLSFVM